MNIPALVKSAGIKIFFILCILILCGCSTNMNLIENDDLHFNSAPNFSILLHTNDNYPSKEILDLTNLDGKPVVINFWFPSCPPCRTEMPYIEASYNIYIGQVEFVAIQQVGIDSIEDGQKFVNDFGLTFAVGADKTGQIITDYELTAFPSTYFLDSDHKIIHKWTGELNMGNIKKMINDILP